MPRGIYNRGQAHTPAQLAGVRANGRAMAGRVGTEANAFKPDAQSSARHKWINRRYPRKGQSEDCGRTGRTHYHSIGHTYTRDRADWIELCPRCHKRHNEEGR